MDAKFSYFSDFTFYCSFLISLHTGCSSISTSGHLHVLIPPPDTRTPQITTWLASSYPSRLDSITSSVRLPLATLFKTITSTTLASHHPSPFIFFWYILHSLMILHVLVIYHVVLLLLSTRMKAPWEQRFLCIFFLLHFQCIEHQIPTKSSLDICLINEWRHYRKEERKVHRL